MISARLFGPLIFFALPVLVFLQSTLLANSLPGQVTPNLVFLLTVLCGYRWGATGGACTGMWGGALTGAAVGSVAVPFSFLYGTLGWLAGIHKERHPQVWTLPLTGMALFMLLLSGEAYWSPHTSDIYWRFKDLGWMAVFCCFFLLTPSLVKQSSSK